LVWCDELICSAGKVFEKPHRQGALNGRVAQPTKHCGCVLVDLAHQRNLSALLEIVLLVNANGVYPQKSTPIRRSQLGDDRVQVRRDAKNFVTYQ
jgi:hypothetical protein